MAPIDDASVFFGAATATSVLLLVASLAFRFGGLSALQRADSGACPGLMGVARDDAGLAWLHRGLHIFPLLALLLAVSLLIVNSSVLLAAWLVTVGLSLDLLVRYLSHISGYIDPNAAVEKLVHLGATDAENGRDSELTDKIVILCDLGYHSLRRQTSHEALHTISALGDLLEHFMHANRRQLKSEELHSPNHMRAGYIAAFTTDHLESLCRNALFDQMDPTAIHVLTTLGNASVAAAQGSPEVACQLIQSMGRLALTALETGHFEVCIKGSLTLMETAKMLVSDPEASQNDLHKPLLTAVGQLGDIAKTQFRQDRDAELNFLTQPVRDLKAFFSNDSTLSGRKDVKIALQALETILSDFLNLQLVLNTLPDIPDVEDDDEEGQVPEFELPSDDEAIEMLKNEKLQAPNTPENPDTSL